MIFRKDAETFLFEMSYNPTGFTKIYDFYTKMLLCGDCGGVKSQRSLGAGRSGDLKG